MARRMAEYKNGICIKSGWRETPNRTIYIQKPKGTKTWCESCKETSSSRVCKICKHGNDGISPTHYRMKEEFK